MSLIVPISFFVPDRQEPVVISGAISEVYTSDYDAYKDSNFLFGGLFNVNSETLTGFGLLDSTNVLDPTFRPTLGNATWGVAAMSVSAGNGTDFRFVVGGSYGNIDFLANTQYLTVINLSATAGKFAQSGFFSAQPNNTVFAVYVDDKIYCGGDFTTPKTRCMAYDKTGLLNAAFTCTPNSTVLTIKPSPVDSTVIFIGGNFTVVKSASYRGIAKISKSNGSPVSTFRPLAIYPAGTIVLDIEVQNDGKVIVASALTGTYNKHLIRLPATVSSTSTTYESFQTAMGLVSILEAHKLKYYDDGGVQKLLAAVKIYDPVPNAIVYRVYRFTNLSSTISASTLDTTFGSGGIGYVQIANSSTSPYIASITVDSNDRIILSGSFDTIDGIPKTNFAILDNTGTVL
jgi:hypothetical protein